MEAGVRGRVARSDPWAWLPWAVWLGGLVPGAWLLYLGLTGGLGANPIAEGLNACGELAIKLLLLCLACTPLRIVFGWTAQMRARKHLGLLAFTYAAAHFGVYLGLDRLGDLASVPSDIVERPFILVGFVALMLLVPLALTSSARMVKRLGARRWNRLHALVYVVGILAALHFAMRAKKDLTEAGLHAAVLAVLLGVRVFDRMRRGVRQGRVARGE